MEILLVCVFLVREPRFGASRFINFLDFRENTILLRSNYLLKNIKNRQEIVEALIQAINNLRSIINLIEKSKDTTEAKNNLINRQNDKF